MSAGNVTLHRWDALLGDLNEQLATSQKYAEEYAGKIGYIVQQEARRVGGTETPRICTDISSKLDFLHDQLTLQLNLVKRIEGIRDEIRVMYSK